jgi:hypothetical protein
VSALPPLQLKYIDEWRLGQLDQPSRSEAIRRLLLIVYPQGQGWPKALCAARGRALTRMAGERTYQRRFRDHAHAARFFATRNFKLLTGPDAVLMRPSRHVNGKQVLTFACQETSDTLLYKFVEVEEHFEAEVQKSR